MFIEEAPETIKLDTTALSMKHAERCLKEELAKLTEVKKATELLIGAVYHHTRYNYQVCCISLSEIDDMLERH